LLIVYQLELNDSYKWTHEESCSRDNVKRFNNACI
jgi:hypothetical protein